MALLVTETLKGRAWVARPNRSLTPNQARRLVFAAAGVTGVIALAFACFGAWPVIPFAGLEVAALWLALNHLQRHANDEECIDISDTCITVSRSICGQHKTYQFSRYWARLQMDNRSNTGSLRLFLRSHGREQEIGRLLTEEQKYALAKSLRNQLGATQE